MKIPMIVALGFAAALPIAAGAQSTPTTGDRVRIHQPDGSVLVGTVVEASPSRMRLSSEGRELTADMDGIVSMERSQGAQRQFGKHFAITMGVGALVLGTLWAVTFEPCGSAGGCSWVGPDSRGGAFAWGLVGGGVLSIPVGVVVGLVAKGERWESIPIPGRTVAFSIEPLIGRAFALRGSIVVGGARR